MWSLNLLAITILFGCQWINGCSARVPLIKRLEYDPSNATLTCTYSGPVSEVVWQKDGVTLSRTSKPSEVLEGGTLDDVETFLLREGPPWMVVGTYSCGVRGLGGTWAKKALELRGLQVTGIKPVYNSGDGVSLMCSTDLNYTKLSWYQGKQLLISENTLPRVALRLEAVTDYLNKEHYICRMESTFGEQSLAFVLVFDEVDVNEQWINIAVFMLCVFMILCTLFIIDIGKWFYGDSDNHNHMQGSSKDPLLSNSQLVNDHTFPMKSNIQETILLMEMPHSLTSMKKPLIMYKALEKDYAT